MPWFAYAHYPALEAGKQTVKATEEELVAGKRQVAAGFPFLSEILKKLLYNAARHEDASFPSHQCCSVAAKQLIRRGLRSG